MYYDSVSELPTYLVTTANPYVELTDMDTYSSTLYTTMKEEFNVRKTYLMNPSYMISTFLSSFNVNIRKYIKSISSINTPILVVELNNNEYEKNLYPFRSCRSGSNDVRQDRGKRLLRR